MIRTALMLVAVDTERRMLERELEAAGARLRRGDWVPPGMRSFEFPTSGLRVVVDVTGESNDNAQRVTERRLGEIGGNVHVAVLAGTACGLKDSLEVGTVVAATQIDFYVSDSVEGPRQRAEETPVSDRALLNVAKELGYTVGRIFSGPTLIKEQRGPARVRGR